MYGTYSWWWFHAELRPSEVDPCFNFFFYKKYTVIKKDTATIFEWEVPKRIAFLKSGFRKTLFVLGPLLRKLWPCLFSLRCTSCKKKNWNEGQLRRAVTRHEIIKNYMSHTYSESPGRALSHGATQFMSYICKKISKSRFRDPSEQGFLRFSELGSPDYIVKTTIFSVWVFLMVSVHGNTLYAIAIHKNRSITPF